MKFVCSVSWCLAMCMGGALCAGGLATVAAQGAAPQSSAVARELARLMGEQKLDAAAARDPEQPDRFIAALYYQVRSSWWSAQRIPFPSIWSSVWCSGSSAKRTWTFREPVRAKASSS
jgi:hypothetical protein